MPKMRILPLYQSILTHICATLVGVRLQVVKLKIKQFLLKSRDFENPRKSKGNQ